MTRRCSHCNHNGHNSRTCPARGVKVFGVRLDGPTIRKSVSMGNLGQFASNGGGSSPEGIDGGATPEGAMEMEKAAGYVSEDFAKGSSSSRKKGVAWTEEEHKKFLLGLQTLGKGDWRGISSNFVSSRTPAQVASHAQKYFIRQCNSNKRKKRTSLFDISMPDEIGDAEVVPAVSAETETNVPLPPHPPPVDAESEPVPNPGTTQYPYHFPYVPYMYPVTFPAFYPPYYPVPVPFFPGQAETTENRHEVVKPTAGISRIPSTEQLAAMSKLSLRDFPGEGTSSMMTLNLLGDPERHSAFRANITPTAAAAAAGTRTDANSSPIRAV